MTGTPIRVLFVCTGNSARSVMAEALVRQKGGDRFEVHSAGTDPRGINPLTRTVLAEAGIDTSWARSKSVTEYLGQQFDYVVTVCDEARQACPVFPGVHESLHWGYEDPAEATGARRNAWRSSGACSSSSASGSTSSSRSPAPAERAPGRGGSAGPRRLSRAETGRDEAMELYLLRHAHAGDPEAWDGPDDRRPLSDKGEKQADRLGRFLAGIGFTPDAIITSPKARAAQTAALVAAQLGDAGDRGRPARRRADHLRRWRRSCAMRATRVGPSWSATTPTSASSSRPCAAPPEVPMKKGALARIDASPPARARRRDRCAGSCRPTCSSPIASRTSGVGLGAGSRR